MIAEGSELQSGYDDHRVMHPGTCQLGWAAQQRRAGDILSARAHLQSSNSTVITVVQSYATTSIWRSTDYDSIFQNYTPPNLPINHNWLTIIMKNWLTPSPNLSVHGKKKDSPAALTPLSQPWIMALKLLTAIFVRTRPMDNIQHYFWLRRT